MCWPRRTTSTPRSGSLRIQPSVTVTCPGGPHLLKVHLTFLAGTAPLDPHGDYGYALYKGVMPPGGATLEEEGRKKNTGGCRGKGIGNARKGK
ncbi:MAG: hypothetical protein LBG27_00800 [Spirochaetaceae bacterium]|nr:hypothetical protein [Spirochaetaceae bacterium]